MPSPATMPSTDAAPRPLVEVANLVKVYSSKTKAPFRAVDDVSFRVLPGEVLGIVGESGSGKSTIARLVLRLVEPTEGRILFDGEDLTRLDGEALRRQRRHMQLVFQNPHSALNGRHTIGDAVAEPFRVQRAARGADLEAKVDRLLDTVGLPRAFKYRYPHELSGGQKQRVCIARAVALNPKLLILDEPTSALDVSVQAQVLRFLRDLKGELGLTYMFISHDLAVIRYLCDRVLVMNRGRIVEEGETQSLFDNPREDYSRNLIASVPRLPQHEELPR